MKWLIPANINKYNFIKAFDELGVLDWTKTANYNIGDIVYIYGSKPYQRIMYKTEVLDANINQENTIDDLKYWKGSNSPKKSADTIYIRLQTLTKYYDEELSLEYLLENGLKRPPQGPMYVKDELLTYIELIEADVILNTIGGEVLELSDTEKDVIAKARIGQGVFRDRLIIKDSCCRICGLSNKNFLVASHIKPWIKSNNKEKLDENNGLLLCPNHDALFDKGYISFNGNGTIMITKKIDEVTKKLLNINNSINIDLNVEEYDYMKYHRENIFIDNLL